MRCGDLEILERYASDESGASAVEAHLARCARCRGSLEEIRENLAVVPVYRTALRHAAPAAAEGTPSTLGPYRILRELDRGGMGVVYEAEDPRLRRRVALKLLPGAPGEDGDSGVRRLEREAQLLAAINHPNIATIHTLEVADGRRFLTMEYVEGETLARHVRDRGPLPVDRAMAVGRQIAHALTAAHRRNVVHLDLKPHNVMIDGTDRVKILDFGLARALADGGTAVTEEFSGTAGFASPEQVRGEPLDPRADLWGFGCVLYECLAGRRAFDGEGAAERIAATLETDPDWGALPAETPDSLRGLLAGLLEKDRERRPDSMTEVRRILEEEMTRRRLSRFGGEEPASPVHDLPRPLSSFVGRRADLEALGQRMRAHRLVTLTGAGGSGKSRLAIEAARTHAADLADETWFVELAALGDPDLIPQAVARVLGLKETAGRGYGDVLSAFVRSRRVLLVLDNCEHVRDGTASLARALFDVSPGLRILASSRVALGVEGEAVYPVPPLDLPRSGLDLPALSTVDSVRLFLDRARLVRPGFRLTEADAAHVIEICRRLDGIPLALELAAARMRMLTAGEIARRLDQRFDLLTGTGETRLPHHRTLRALIEWSHDQLTPPERVLFRRLAVFAGGWTLDAAESVVADDELPEWEVLDRLAGLVEKSVVEIDTEAERRSGQPRFRMLETVRAFAGERLEAAGEEPGLGRRHRGHYTALAENALPELRGRGQSVWLTRLSEDDENLRRAVESALNVGDAETALALTGALGRYWDYRGRWTDGRNLLGRALALPTEGPATQNRARALNWIGNLSQYFGDYEASEGYHRESMEISRRNGDAWYEASSLNNLGTLASLRGEFASAREHHERSLALRRGVGDRWAEALSVYQLGAVSMREADYPGARRRFEESLALWKEVGDEHCAGIVLASLGWVHLAAGDREAAARVLEESREIHRGSEDLWAVSSGQAGFARLALARGDLSGARVPLGECLRLRMEVGDRPAVAQCLEIIAQWCVAGGDLESGARLLGAADAVREGLGAPRSPLEESPLEESRNRLRNGLDPAAQEAALEAGRRLSLEEAAALAEAALA